MLIYLILLCCLFFSYLTIFVLVLSYLCMYSSLSLYMIFWCFQASFFSVSVLLQTSVRVLCPTHSAKEPAFLSMDWASEEESSLALRTESIPSHSGPQSQWHGFIGWKIWGGSVSIIFVHIFIGLGDCLSAQFSTVQLHCRVLRWFSMQGWQGIASNPIGRQ